MFFITINDRRVLVKENTSIIEVCEMLSILIPKFCYHERLKIAGNCRMCLVELEDTSKPITSCTYPVNAEDLQVHTNSSTLEKARENILEFLLINHPLDCPICDQGGECDLQEQVLHFGSDRTRYKYVKRTTEDKNCGLLIKTIMTRCIHCTRCVRFFEEIVGISALGLTMRGKEAEIGTYTNEKNLSEFSGNVIDLCPVGALTSKPYAFNARLWDLKSGETIDLTENSGSNIKINYKENEIIRILPVLNDSLNEEWISDKARFSFDGLKTQRIVFPYLKENKKLYKISWKKVLESNTLRLNFFIRFQTEQILIICGNNLDLKTLEKVKKITNLLNLSLINETFIDFDTDLMFFVKSNTTFSEMTNTNACLTIATNIRFEASILNLRLKKQSIQEYFTKASIGLPENLNYSNYFLGNTATTITTFTEGFLKVCKYFAATITPFIIIGSSAKKRIDSLFFTLFYHLIFTCLHAISDVWVGFSYIPLSCNNVGQYLSGINPNRKIQINQKRYIYTLGIDSFDDVFLKLKKKNSSLIIQTAFFSHFIKEADLIFSSTSFVEKEEIFVNLEGRLQKTTQIMKSLFLAKNDSHILTKGFSKILKDIEFWKSDLLIKTNKHAQNRMTFLKFLIFSLAKQPGKLCKISYINLLSNFFLTNSLTKNSTIMNKCASIVKKTFLNFF